MSEPEKISLASDHPDEQIDEAMNSNSADGDDINVDGTLDFDNGPDQPETIEGLREQVLKLKKELMEAQYEFRQKNKENADLRLKEKKDLNERIQSQSLVIEELKSKIGDIDILNQKISSLTEEKNHLLIENSKQKEIILELMENSNVYSMPNLQNIETRTNDDSKAAIIRNMIDISKKIKSSYQDFNVAQKND
ncbi:hypothetical protein M9Y10_017499 [Tritrichomonas musculus]|uniref:Uncharacterized protein n=1 Tax=Tritrichomonas musculus TaxID=1915356 RepID=A0ABR2HUK7_9EUKA